MVEDELRNSLQGINGLRIPGQALLKDHRVFDPDALVIHLQRGQHVQIVHVNT